ncbi:MAG: signal recognition particle protein [Victivallales bacterium]|nr:signal recognition particle protein [Victivallales bacterium]
MFDSLSDKLQDTFKRLRGQARLSESNMTETLREIRMALLDADVNINIVKDFVAAVKEDCLGSNVLRSVTPGQQLVKIVNDRLVELMGESEAGLDLSSNPSVIMMVGLHGSGKTTSSAKLAARLKKDKKKVLLVAGDVYRPAAIDQLEVLGREVEIPVYTERGNMNVAAIARNAVDHAIAERMDVVIIDTAGRLQIDESMVQELVQVSQISRANEILLVADSALGQEAVSVAEHFNNALGLTGIVLTKLDGDARGGAALSIRKVTGCPIKFVGLGEKVQDFDIFYPERMASRILGMGDVVSLVEKAAEEIDEKEAQKQLEKLKRNEFDFNDFLSQMRQISKLGGLESMLKFLPGGKELSGLVNVKEFSRMEAIICSMTKQERAEPELINLPRRKRISKGSGTTLEQVSQLIKHFNQMRKMMKKTGIFGKMLSGMGGLGGLGRGGEMPSMDAAAMAAASGGIGGLRGSMARGCNFTPSKKKKRKKK